MLTWPHCGFHVHTAVWVPEEDRAFATRLARYCARNPVALERLANDRAAKAVTYRSDESEGPTAGTETVDPLEFLPRVFVHIPDKGHVTTRCYGWYANRPRGIREKAEPAAADGPARNRPHATTRAHRGQPPVGFAAPADLRGRSPRVSCLPRRDAGRRVHHPSVGDRPDPHPPPHPRGAGGPRRRAESPIDPGTGRAGCPATFRGDTPGPLSLTSTPRAPTGTFGVRGRPTAASPKAPPTLVICSSENRDLRMRSPAASRRQTLTMTGPLDGGNVGTRYRVRVR